MNDNRKVTVEQLLKDWNCLSWKSKDNKYLLDILLEEGYETPESLYHLTTDALEKFKIKHYHIKILLNHIQNIKIKQNDPIFNTNNENTINIPNNINFKNVKTIKNPYIILIGISDYKLLDNTGKYDLLATINDTKYLTKLFSNIYGFKHVICVQDFIVSKNLKSRIDIENLEEFLEKQRDKINELCSNNSVSSPDSLFIFYTGHGKNNGIMMPDGDTFEYRLIQDIFSNKNLNGLTHQPKCLYFDCCRGKISIKAVEFNSRGLDDNKTDEKSENDHNTLLTNKYSDIMITYSTVSGTKSYDNKQNGYLIMSLYSIYKDLNYMKFNTLHNASLKVKTLVHYHSKYSQTCEIINRLDYDVKLIPNHRKDNKFVRKVMEEKSDYKIKSGVLTVNEFYSMYWFDNDKLGSGSFSKVLKITRKLDHKQCAVKLLKASDIQSFKQEIKILQQCKNNNNIIKLLNYIYNYNNKSYIILEYFNGGSVLDRLKNEDGLSEKHVFNIIKQVCNGLDYLHSRKIAHRDIKPNNLMYSDKSKKTIKIIDFGLASDCSNNLLIQKCGTLHYMAPEILKSIPYDTKVDMWSLGVTMYFLLSKRLPFYHQNEANLVALIISGKYSFSHSSFDFITDKSKTLIKKLLVIDSMKRLSAKRILSNKWMNNEENNDTLLQYENELLKCKNELYKVRNNLKNNLMDSYFYTQIEHLSKPEKEEIKMKTTKYNLLCQEYKKFNVKDFNLKKNKNLSRNYELNLNLNNIQFQKLSDNDLLNICRLKMSVNKLIC